MMTAGAVDHYPLYDVGKDTVGVVLRARQLRADKAIDHGRV